MLAWCHLIVACKFFKQNKNNYKNSEKDIIILVAFVAYNVAYLHAKISDFYILQVLR